MKVIVDGLAVEYKDEGAGSVLLLLHGWMHSLHNFDGLANILSTKYRVVRIDLPGFGGSQLPPVPWYTEDYAKIVRAFLLKISAEPTVIIGHSFGGMITMKGVGEGLLKPGKIVLIDSSGNARRNTPRLFFYKSVAKVGKVFSFFMPSTLYASLRKRIYEKSGSDYLDAGALSQTFLNTVNETLTDDARKITIPTLLLWGEKDTTTPLENAKRLAAVILNSKLIAFPGLGHSPHIESPQQVAKAIEQFV